MKRILALLCAAAVLGAGAALAASIMDKEVFAVGTEATFPPFEYHDASNAIVGFDVELMQMVAAKLGKKAEFVEVAFDGLIPSLMTGKIDMIIAGMSNKPERAEKVNFSRVYYTAADAFIVRNDDAAADLSGLKGKIVTVQNGSLQNTFANDQKETLGIAEIKPFPKTDDAIREVLLNRADVAIVDGNVAKKYLKEVPEFGGALKIAFRHRLSPEGQGMCIAMPKGDEAATAAVNKALDELDAEGKLKELRVKYELE